MAHRLMTTKDTFNNKQNTLLTELESIKTLLGDDHRKIDNIPLLQTPVSQFSGLPEASPISVDTSPGHDLGDDKYSHNDIPTQPTTTHGVLPGQQSLFNTTDNTANKQISLDTPNKAEHTTASAQQNTEPHQRERKARATLADNPFLPAHVRQRLQGDEQATTESPPLTTVDASYSQQLVDQLVAHHLPKIEAELRQKLMDVIQQHNQHIEK